MIDSRLRAVVAALVAVFVLIGSAGCVPIDSPAPGIDVAVDSGEVKEGTDAEVTAGDDVTVKIPGGSISGSGTLSVTPSGEPMDGWSAWDISLDGATLVGDATIVFHNLRGDDPDEPAPLVFSSEPQGDIYQTAKSVVWDGNDAVVTTDHFSNWFTRTWESVASWTRGAMDNVNRPGAVGQQPSCPNEASARDQGLTVESSDGERVMWCVGVDDGGQYVMKVTNTRGYAVSIEETSGVVLTNADTNLNSFLPQLFSVVTDQPTKPENVVHLIGSGETNEYRLHGEGPRAVMVKPSGGAYIATALLFAASTIAEVVPSKDLVTWKKRVLEVLSGTSCALGIEELNAGDMGNPAAVAAYINNTVGTILGCSAEVLEHFALDVSIASGLSWLASGIRLLGNGVGAIVDSTLNAGGYRIFATLPTPPDQCQDIYSVRLFAELSSWMRLNEDREGMTDESVAFDNPVLTDIARANADEGTCFWTTDSYHYGIYTRVSELTAEEAATVAATLEASGYAQETIEGFTRYHWSVPASEGELGESHYLRNNTWVATGWSGIAPNGYTRDIVETIW